MPCLHLEFPSATEVEIITSMGDCCFPSSFTLQLPPSLYSIPCQPSSLSMCWYVDEMLWKCMGILDVYSESILVGDLLEKWTIILPQNPSWKIEWEVWYWLWNRLKFKFCFGGERKKPLIFPYTLGEQLWTSEELWKNYLPGITSSRWIYILRNVPVKLQKLAIKLYVIL